MATNSYLQGALNELTKYGAKDIPSSGEILDQPAGTKGFTWTGPMNDGKTWFLTKHNDSNESFSVGALRDSDY